MAFVNISLLGLAVCAAVFFFYLIKVVKFEKEDVENEGQRLSQYVGKKESIKLDKKLKSVPKLGDQQRK